MSEFTLIIPFLRSRVCLRSGSSSLVAAWTDPELTSAHLKWPSERPPSSLSTSCFLVGFVSLNLEVTQIGSTWISISNYIKSDQWTWLRFCLFVCPSTGLHKNHFVSLVSIRFQIKLHNAPTCNRLDFGGQRVLSEGILPSFTMCECWTP